MSVRVFVEVGCEIDSSLNLRIDRQTGLPVADDGDDPTRVSRTGRAGMSAALDLSPDALTAFAVGPGHECALRHAAAAGASQLVQLGSEAPENERGLISSMAEWLAAQRPDLVIMDRHAGQVATRLGWAHLAGLSRLRVEDGRLFGVRQLDRGASEAVWARFPAIVRLQTDAAPLLYVARARIAQAELRSVTQARLNPAEAPLPSLEAGPLQVSRPRTRLGTTLTPPAPAKANARLGSLMSIAPRSAAMAAAKPAAPVPKTPDEMAAEVIRYLAHHQLL